MSFNTVRMRLLETLGGAVSLGLAVCLGLPAGIEGRRLISSPADGPLQVHNFVIGNVELTGWTLVGIFGAMSISFGVLAFYLLFPREKPHWQTRSGDRLG